MKYGIILYMRAERASEVRGASFQNVPRPVRIGLESAREKMNSTIRFRVATERGVISRRVQVTSSTIPGDAYVSESDGWDSNGYEGTVYKVAVQFVVTARKEPNLREWEKPYTLTEKVEFCVRR